MVDWPVNNNSNSLSTSSPGETKTFTQAKDADMAKQKAESEAKYAELNKKYDDLKKEIEKLQDAVKSINVHKQSDLDANSSAQHHTLGLGPNNAATGAHTHDGLNSKRLNMVGTPMVGANFAGTNLSGANLAGTNLLVTSNQAGINLKPEQIAIITVPADMKLLNGGTLTGSRTSDTWRVGVTNALVRLGMGNTSTA